MASNWHPYQLLFYIYAQGRSFETLGNASSSLAIFVYMHSTGRLICPQEVSGVQAHSVMASSHVIKNGNAITLPMFINKYLMRFIVSLPL